MLYYIVINLKLCIHVLVLSFIYPDDKRQAYAAVPETTIGIYGQYGYTSGFL